MRMALIMSATVAEFFVFQWPMSGVVLTVIFQKMANNMTIQANMGAIGYSLWFIDAAINPLWTTFLSKKRNAVSGQNNKSTMISIKATSRN